MRYIVEREALPLAARLAAPLLTAGLVAFAPAALAQDAPKSYPHISGELSLEAEDDWTVDSEDPTAELNDIFATIELAAALHFTEAFSLNGSFLIEPVFDAVDDREFEDHGFFAEELYLKYDAGVAAVFIGKFNPTFGTAWDLTPGIYGADFAEDYELSERIGGGVAVPFNAAGAEHTVTLNAFFADTTFLSESAGQNRGRTRESDAGPSNTEDPSSFSLTLDGGLPTTDLSYHLGTRYQTGGTGDVGDDIGFVAGLNGEWDLGDETSIMAIGEVAYFDDQDASNSNGIYGTVGGAYSWSQWTASASYSLREQENGLSADHLIQTSLGYEFDFGLGVELGYRYGEEAKVDSHTLGALLSYSIIF